MTDSLGGTAEQARALGAPTRRAILLLLAEADGPMGVADLTDALGLNHNAVRKHLAVLVDAGMVVESHALHEGPGRPRLVYRLDPTGAPAAASAYERLAVLLARALATGESPVAVGRDAGAQSGPAAEPGASPIDLLAARFEQEGFAPEVRRRGRRNRAEIVLNNCPFASAAEANAEAVCSLHLGLAQGAADVIGGLAVDGIAPRDPRQAGCRLAVTELD